MVSDLAEGSNPSAGSSRTSVSVKHELLNKALYTHTYVPWLLTFLPYNYTSNRWLFFTICDAELQFQWKYDRRHLNSDFLSSGQITYDVVKKKNPNDWLEWFLRPILWLVSQKWKKNLSCYKLPFKFIKKLLNVCAYLEELAC